MIIIKHHGDFYKTTKFLASGRQIGKRLTLLLNKYGQLGVQALASATPRDTGQTAGSWSYEIEKRNDGYSISWNNTNENQGVSIALILQYGHGLQNGSYVEGIDYINPAMARIFESISQDINQEVSNL